MCIELGCAETLYPEDSRVHRPVLIKVIRAPQRKEEAIAVRNGRYAVGLIFTGRVLFVGNTAAHGPLLVNLVIGAQSKEPSVTIVVANWDVSKILNQSVSIRIVCMW